MNTFILMWNPEISSYKQPDFILDITDFQDKKLLRMNWSVFDYQSLKIGDRFFLLRVGNGNTGIVMSGYFISEPYKDDDWSGKGRAVYYADMSCDIVVDTDSMPYVSTDQLTEAIPNFSWKGGHSGRFLSKDSADKLEEIWFEYLFNNSRLFNNQIPLSDYAKDFIVANKDNVCEVCGYDFQKVWGPEAPKHNINLLFEKRQKAPMTIAEIVKNHVHCLCKNCLSVPASLVCERIGERNFLDIVPKDVYLNCFQDND